MFTPIILLVIFPPLFLYLFCFHPIKKRSTLINWPVLGMLPTLFSHRNGVHDFLTECLQQNGGTFVLKGPWFGNMDLFITCDPANIHHILSKNFQNFSKGPGFKKIFDVLGDGIFNAEFESWEKQRKIIMSLFNQPGYPEFIGSKTWMKVDSGLIPILNHFSEMGMEVDLQELFQRFAFDFSCISILGHDPASLRVDLPYIREVKSFVDAEEVLLRRHILPEWLWQLEKWLQIGKEKKLSEAMKNIDLFLSNCISLNSQKFKKMEPVLADDANQDLDLLTSYMRLELAENDAPKIPEQTWKDTVLNLIVAGKDTISAALTWFFWLLATHPAEETKIRQEIWTNLPVHDAGKWTFFDKDELKKLVYLHCALCESLRLFPPVGLQHKAPMEPNTLPSGHRIKPNTKTVLSFYSMGRMESIWGEDCLEFKPGRWITDQGRIKNEPSFKFTAFNAGPRSCIGKEISFIQLKTVAVSIISRFKFQVVETRRRSPSNSVVLHMKRGLKVKVSKI